MRIDPKQHAHELVDQLAPSQLAAVVRLLEVMIDGEEPVTDEDRRRIHDGQAWFPERGGRGIPMEYVLTEFGLKPEDFPFANNAAYRIDWLDEVKVDVRRLDRLSAIRVFEGILHYARIGGRSF
ncbi:MAG: hypothetical protein JOZ43_08865 [Acidobacteriales bacterium]|nr:hypothetical protein [Terriglobales bacterium]